MADVNANIGVNIDTSNALAQIKSLQRQLSQFYTSIAKSSETAALAQRDLQRNLINSVNSLGAFSAEMRTIKTSAESFTDSLEKNKFSMREYFRYAGASTKTFGKLFRSEFDTINKVAEENVKRLQTQYIKLGRDSTGAMKAIAVIPRELNMEDFATKTQIAAQRQALFNQLVKQGSTNLLNFGKNTQWAGRQLMVGFTIPLTILGNTAARTFMEMETAALKFRKVYGDLFTPTAEREQALADIQALGQSFTKYGIAVSATTNLAAEAAAAGFQGLDLQRQVTEATRLQVLGQVDQQKALETTISLQNAFAMSSEDLADAINFLNAVENQTVVSLDDITTAIPKAAPVVKQLGGDVRDLAFFMAAMKEGGINASEGANALKSGLASLINPTDKAREMMQGFGIDIDQIVNKNAGNVKQTVIDFALALDNLSNLNRQRAIEQLFGKFQLARLSTLFENVTKNGNQASRVLDLATASTEDLAGMAESELGMTADSAMNKFRKSVEDLKFALVPVGQAFLESVTPIVEFLGDILEKFNNLSDGAKKAITILTVGIGAIGPVALMTFGLLANGLANGIKFIQILRNGYLRLTGQSAILGEQTQYLTVQQQNAAAVAHSLDQSHATLTQTFNAEAAALRNLITAYTNAASAAQRFAMTNPGMMMPPRAKGYADGIVSVPGPRGAGDVVPAMLSPGEAVIPADMAKKYSGLIQGMVSGNIPGYRKGRTGTAGKNVKIPGGFAAAHFGGSTFRTVDELLAMIEGRTDKMAESLRTMLNAIGDGSKKITVFTNEVVAMGSDLNEAVGKTGSGKKVAFDYAKSEMLDPAKASVRDIELQRQLEKAGVSIEDIRAVNQKITQNITDGFTKLAGKTELTAEDIDKLITDAYEAVAKTDARVQEAYQRMKDPTTLTDPNLLTRRPITGESYKTFRKVNRAKGVSPYQEGMERMVGAGNVPYSKEAQFRLTNPMLTSIGLSGDDAARIYDQFSKEVKIKLSNLRNDITAFTKEFEAQAELAGLKTGKSYQVGLEKSRMQDPYVESRQRQSPHPLAAKDGSDDGNAYETARQNAIKKRRVASSPGGTVGPGGIIISPTGGAGGGGGGGGPTFLGMPGMPDRESRRQTMRQRLGNVRGNLAAGKYAGVGMGASMGVMAASMLPGKMGELASKMMPVIFGFQALQMILKFLPGPFKAFTVALGIGLGIMKLVNAARERERLAIEGLADAMSTTAKQAKALGDFFGVVPKARPFELGQREIVGAETRSQREALKADPTFQKEFKNTIQSLRKATNEEAKLVFSSLALNLRAQGFAKDQVQVIIDALREEAGKTDVSLNVKNLDLSKQSIADLQSQMLPIISQFSSEMNKSITRSATSMATGQLVTWVDMTKGAKKSLNTLAKFISETGKNAAAMFEFGIIDGKTFEATITSVVDMTNKLDAAQRKILLTKMFEKLGVNADLFLGKLTDVKQEIMLTALLSAGVLKEGSTVLADLMATGQDAEFRRARGVYGLEQAYKKLFKTIKDVNDEQNDGSGNGDGTGEESPFQKLLKQLKEQTKEVNNSVSAFGKLRKAGIDTARAMELSKDPLLAMVLNSKLTKEQFKQIVDLIKQLDKGLDRGAFKDFINNLRSTNEVKRNFAGLAAQMKAMGLEASDIESLLDNPEIVGYLTDGMETAGVRAQRLQELVNQVTASKIIDIEFRLKNDPTSLISDTASKAMDYFSAQEAFVISQMESSDEWKATVATINEANAAIEKGQNEIAGYEKKIADLEYELKYNKDFGEERIRSIEAQIAAEQKLIDAEEEKIAAIEDQIALEQEKIDKINEQIDASQKIIDNTQRYIDLNFDRPIQKLQEESDVLSNTLDLISRQEDKINEKYDAQEEALSRISKINQDISNQKKQQISLADALTQGDISAAAQIAQEMQAAKAQSALDAQQNALGAARQAELGAINVGGMTRGQIEERQFQISQQIFNLEQQRKPFIEAIRAEEDKIYNLKLQIEPIEKKIADYNKQIEGHRKAIEGHDAVIKGYQEQIAAIEVTREEKNKLIRDYQAQIDKINKEDVEPAKTRVKQAEDIQASLKKAADAAIEQHKYAGLSKPEWEAIQKAIEAGRLDGELLAKATEAMHRDVTQMVEKWTNMPPVKELTLNTTENVTRYITEIITQIINQVPGTGNSGGGGSGGGETGPVFAAMGGKIKRKFMAAGGMTLGSDTVPAMLSPGEFVVNRAATARFEPLLNAMNQGGYAGFETKRYRVSNAPTIVPTGSSQLSTIINNNATPVYNYNLSVNVDGSQADPNAIANTVITKIRQLQDREIRRQVV